MKSILTILLVLIFNPIYTVAAQDFKVDLIKNCVAEKCEPRVWFAIDSYDPSYHAITSPNENWKEIKEFPIWMNKFFKKEGRLATYTLMTYFDLPQEILNHQEQAGIQFGEIGEAFEIYMNGNLIAKEGEIKDGRISFHRTVRGKVWQVPKNSMQEKNNHLLVKLSGHPKFDHTGFYLTKHYDFGLADDLKYAEQDRITLALLSIYLTVGLYHLFLFYRRRIEIYNFYYGAFAFIVGIYMYTRSSVIFEHNWDTALIQRLEIAVLYPGLVFLIESLDSLFFNKVGKWTKRYRYFSYSICGITVFCPEMYQAEYILRVWQISVLTCALPLLGIIFYQGIQQGVSNAKRLLTGIVIFILAAIYDIIDSLFVNSGLSFSKYAFFMYIIGFAGILANRFISIHNEIEELNENLEIKVDNRTKELTKSFTEIKLLKDQQDGDYFLTSLLLHPLGANQAKSESVKVEFFLKQKKDFTFKQWESEIGGDLCRAQTIKLKNRPMTLFLNADAMGKSMQGAGGALVAGAVFNSIIERTLLSPTVQNQHPERWLKNSFVEMHKVFASFDGSMLISVIMGIVDNDSGLMYFINAEHPYTVLYRDGKPSFIGDEKLYRKLGSSIVDDFIFIQIFQMRDGDIIINGSDGRDDLLMPSTESNAWNLNYDEKIFLSVVEKANGDLGKIYDQLQLVGELTDDLSLLRIEFNNPNMQINSLENQELPDFDIAFEKLDSNTEEKLDLKLKEFYTDKVKNFRTLKYISIGYINLRKYDTAISLIIEYLNSIPSDSSMLYFLSYAYRKNKNYRDSIDQGERLRLRNPYHMKNLINLVQSYATSRNFIRAFEILESASNLQPENGKILRLKSQIAKRMELKN